MLKSSNRLVTMVNHLIDMPERIEKVFQKAKEIKDTQNKMEETLKDLDYKMTNFREDFDETIKWLFPEKKIIKSEQLGTSAIFPAQSCYAIKSVFPHKLSGYFKFL